MLKHKFKVGDWVRHKESGRVAQVCRVDVADRPETTIWHKVKYYNGVVDYLEQSEIEAKDACFTAEELALLKAGSSALGPYQRDGFIRRMGNITWAQALNDETARRLYAGWWGYDNMPPVEHVIIYDSVTYVLNEECDWQWVLDKMFEKYGITKNN